MSQPLSHQQYRDLNSSTQSSEGEDYVPKRIVSKSNTRKIHKIPIEQQKQLFRQVFQEGKQIKEVAKTLDLNYSSAKSLIHYYKNNKRSVPVAILDVLNTKKTTGYRVSKTIPQNNKNLKIEVRENNELIRSYCFYEDLASIN
ncbi:unnamed protein product (macronuclear) [Paramecium tetraurelia]|uniref:HTH psq-type domain-containing protein n=1 Tax=Paramecium tetraurelia TaxID=5888 RepID=A0CK93_PARTE|nr:uncharacterized protein GSPATT00000923001 [Paramecium tetraurelia]CAK71210.1 unnamed protein product [Paramecium tetraurelia]|eukprot:XP_001438607.1 hypothetical protein (macronuclear) [Paramecium tetraurelia strain d4-2]